MPNSSSDGSDSGSGDSGTTTTLSAPTGLTAAAQSSSEITLSWNAVSGASSYNIYYGTNSSNANARLYTSSSTTRCTVSSLSANTMYYFWIKACASDGTESSFSNFANARTNADTATVYFVGSSTAIDATGFNNIYIGNYQFGDLFTSVKVSKVLTAGAIDGPYKIKAGTYLLKFGNPATGKVSNSYSWSRRSDDRVTKPNYGEDYEFYFETGKTYTIAKNSSSSYRKSGRITIFYGSHTISAKEGTD